MNKKLRYFLILLFTVVSISNVYSQTINNNTYKTKSNAILVSSENLNTKEKLTNETTKNKENKNDFSFFGEKSELPEYLVPVGNTVGIKINTDGILVLGTGYINTTDGRLLIPAKDKVFVGDIIYKVNGESVKNKEDLEKVTSNAENVELVLNRNGETITTTIKAEKSVIDEKYKIGLWVRDTTQGIGTISFYDPKTNEYYALGHGILDIDTKELMKVKDGEVLACDITSISKGAEGSPGEIIGEIKVGQSIGTVEENTLEGVKGKVTNVDNLNIVSEKLTLADKADVKVGEAYILSNVNKGQVEKYKINILQVDKNSIGNKNMVIEITDEKLLNVTSGIIQGMSGSPIIQDNKIVGAVTHVFVNNPKKGYGVFVENMVK